MRSSLTKKPCHLACALVALSLPISANSACAGTRPASSAPQKSPTATIPTGGNSAAAGGTCFKGATFPSESAWLSFNALVAQHTGAMGTFDSSTEIADVLSASQSVAQMSGGILDPRVIFAQMIQESQGNAHTAAGDGGISYGLMQIQITPGNAIDCASTAKGGCSSDRILDMFKEYLYGNGGSGSTFAVPGIGSCLQANGNDVARALRCYNTGSVPDPSDLSVVSNESTPNYVSNIGNILIGQTPPSAASCGFANAGVAPNELA